MARAIPPCTIPLVKKFKVLELNCINLVVILLIAVAPTIPIVENLYSKADTLLDSDVRSTLLAALLTVSRPLEAPGRLSLLFKLSIVRIDCETFFSKF